MIIDYIIYFLIGTLSGMGVGSAGLLVIYLTLFNSTPQLTAQGINLVFYLFSCGTSLAFHFKKRKFKLTIIVWMILSAIPGVILGSLVSQIVSSTLLRKAFGIMLICAGIGSLRRAFAKPISTTILNTSGTAQNDSSSS